MTAILAILSEAWPYVLAALGVVFGLFSHQRAKTATAQAAQREAEADTRVAQNDAAAAKANETAAQAGAENQKVRRDEDSAAAAVPDAGRVLRDEGWTRD